MTERVSVSISNVGEPADPRAGSQCIRSGNLLFISGQIALDNGELIGPMTLSSSAASACVTSRVL